MTVVHWGCAAREHFSATTSTGTGKPGCLGVGATGSEWQYRPLEGITWMDARF